MKPILFNTDMVRAIQADRKTVTRRVVKPPVMNTIVTQPLQSADKPGMWAFYGEDGLRRAPYRPGDILYVRETWQNGFGGTYLYKADAGLDMFMTPEGKLVSDIPWRPSIHMPRKAARIFLRVKDVRVERLQEMGIDDFKAEGISPRRPKALPGHGCDCSAKTETCLTEPCSNRDAYWEMCYLYPFISAWNSTIKPADLARCGWNTNPWVWVIEFERISRDEAMQND